MKNQFDNDEDERTLDEIPPDEPMGKARVTFDVPMPTVEQVGGEIARQILATAPYQDRESIRKRAREIFDEQIRQSLSEKASAIIEDILSKPMQRTDGFGEPIGEPTTLQAVLVDHVQQWALTPVDSQGHATKPDAYGKKTPPRISWELGRIVNGELSKLVRIETDKIAAQLKESATQNIAKQIGEQVAKLVLK